MKAVQPAAPSGAPPDAGAADAELGDVGPGHADIDAFDRRSLVDSQGRRFPDVRRTLTPRLRVVWAHLLAGYAVLGGTVVALVVAQGRVGWLGPVLIALGALVIGYAVAYIQLFFHEAAHYNIARSRKANDRLANLFIGTIVGQDIRVYRPIHFDHHRFLGTIHDTERSYFDALTWRFLFEALTGIRVLKVLSGRQRAAKAPPRAGAMAKKSLWNAQLLLGIALHGTLVGIALLTHHEFLAVAWALGMALVLPFFASVRQLLEHRDFAAPRNVDYTVTPHGEVHRLFGSGPLASTLGGAGFNRHLLHHWEPQISYTRFRELEAYLMETDLGPVLRTHRVTYLQTFLRLLRAR